MIRFLTVLLSCSLAFAAGDIAGVSAHIGGTAQGGYGAGGTTISAGDVQTDDDLTCDDIACDDIACGDIVSGDTITCDGITALLAGVRTLSYLYFGRATPAAPSQAGDGGVIRGNDAGDDTSTPGGLDGGSIGISPGAGSDDTGGYYAGTGGNLLLYGGAGGTDADSGGTGGNGGYVLVQGGVGTDADNGGDGGDTTIAGGVGGSGSASDGDGGNVIIAGGAAGAGVGGAASGNVQIAEDVIYLGLPNLSLPSYNQLLFAPSTGDKTAGGLAVIQGSSGADATTPGNGGAAGILAIGGGFGGDADTSGDGGSGGDVYVYGGIGGAAAGGGAPGAAKNVVLGVLPYIGTANGSTLAGTATPVSGKEFVTVDASMATLDLTGGTVAVADGGTGASDAATARANLGITDQWTINVLSTVVNKCTDTRLAINWWTAVADAGTQTGISIYANTMTYVDASDWSASQRIAKGSVWTLNPGSTDYCTVADADSLSFGNGSADVAFTIAAWFSVTNNGQIKPILVKGDSYTYSANVEYAFYFDTNENLYFLLCDPSVPARSCARNTGTAYTGWHFVAGTYSGSGGSAGVQLYVDGVAITTTTYNTGSYTAMENLAQSLGILGENDGGNSSGDCDLGFIVIDAAAWSATTVRNVYESTRGWYGL